MMEMPDRSAADEYRDAEQHLNEAVRHLQAAAETGYEMAPLTLMAVGSALETLREDTPS